MRRAHFRFRHVGTQTQMPAHILRPLHKRITNIDRKHHAEKTLFGNKLGGAG
jgi:hypothetical protein